MKGTGKVPWGEGSCGLWAGEEGRGAAFIKGLCSGGEGASGSGGFSLDLDRLPRGAGGLNLGQAGKRVGRTPPLSRLARFPTTPHASQRQCFILGSCPPPDTLIQLKG